jgi:hypothetical protein
MVGGFFHGIGQSGAVFENSTAQRVRELRELSGLRSHIAHLEGIRLRDGQLLI